MKKLFFCFSLALLFFTCDKSEHDDSMQGLTDSIENFEDTQTQSENDLSFRGDGGEASACECELTVENLGNSVTVFDILYVTNDDVTGISCVELPGTLNTDTQTSLTYDLEIPYSNQTGFTCSNSGYTINGDEIVIDIKDVGGPGAPLCYLLGVTLTCGESSGSMLISRLETYGSSLFRVNEVDDDCIISNFPGCFPPVANCSHCSGT